MCSHFLNRSVTSSQAWLIGVLEEGRVVDMVVVLEVKTE